MDISFLGGSSVKLNGRGISVLVDPPMGSKLSGDVVLLTNPELKFPSSKSLMVIDGPGEYEVRSSMITGLPAKLHIDETGQRGTSYVIEIDDVTVVVLGNIAPTLTNDQVEAFSGAHILVVPVGGHGLTLDAGGALEVINRLEPNYVVPVHYDDGKTVYAIPQDKLELFLTEIGSAPEPVAKLKVTAKELPEEPTVVVLSLS